MLTTDTPTTTQVMITSVRSQGFFKHGVLPPIVEEFEIMILEEGEGFTGNYRMLPDGYQGDIDNICYDGNNLSFRIYGFFGGIRNCKLKLAGVATITTGWEGTIEGQYPHPSNGSLVQMSGTVSQISGMMIRKEVELSEEEVLLRGISSKEDAEEMARRTGFGVYEIMQAFRIPHPDDQELLDRMKGSGGRDLLALSRVLATAKGPMAREAALRVLCDQVLIADTTRTVYKIIDAKR